MNRIDLAIIRSIGLKILWCMGRIGAIDQIEILPKTIVRFSLANNPCVGTCVGKGKNIFFWCFPVVQVDRIIESDSLALAVIGFQLAQQERQPCDLPPYLECL